MTVPERRKALEALLADPESRQRLVELMTTLRHDLGNLFGTFTMEAYMLGQFAKRLQQAADDGDLDTVRESLAEIGEIAANLAEAGERARGFLSSLGTVSGGEPDPG